MRTPTEILIDLDQFTGTEMWHRYSPALFPNVRLTDGAAYLAEECGAYWLMDVISSYLPGIQNQDYFVVVKLVKNGDAAVVTLADDEPPTQVFAKQEISFTDFPLDAIKLYASYDGKHWIILLPSEY